MSICRELYYLYLLSTCHELTLSESRVLSSISTCHELCPLYLTNSLHQSHEFYHLYLYVTNSIIYIFRLNVTNTLYLYLHVTNSVIYIPRTHSIRVTSSIIYIYMSRTLASIFSVYISQTHSYIYMSRTLASISHELTLSGSRVLSSISICHELYHAFLTNSLHQSHKFYHLYLYVTNSIIYVFRLHVTNTLYLYLYLTNSGIYISRTHFIRVTSSIIYIYISRTLSSMSFVYMSQTHSTYIHMSRFLSSLSHELTPSESRVLSSMSICHELYHLYLSSTCHELHIIYIYTSRTHSIRVTSSFIYKSQTLSSICHELYHLYFSSKCHELYHVSCTNSVIYCSRTRGECWLITYHEPTPSKSRFLSSIFICHELCY